MSKLKKGTILVHNGEKLVGIEPDGEGKIIIFDSNTKDGIRWQYNSKKSDKIIMNTKDASDDSSYTQMAEFFFSKEKYGSIDNIQILSYMDPGIKNYQIRLYDVSHNKTICEITLNYKKPTIASVDKFEYQPEEDTIIEIQVKNNKLDVVPIKYLNQIESQLIRTINVKKSYVYLIDTTINYSI